MSESEEEKGTEPVALDKETAEILRRLAQRSGRPLSKLTQDLCELYAEQSGFELTWDESEPKESEREELWTKWSSLPDDERRKAFQLMTLGSSKLNALEALWIAWQGLTSEAEKALRTLMKGGIELRTVILLLNLDDDSQFDAIRALLLAPETIDDIVTPLDDTPSPNGEEKEPAANYRQFFCGSCVHFSAVIGRSQCRRLPPVTVGDSAAAALYPRVYPDTPKCGEYRIDVSSDKP